MSSPIETLVKVMDTELAKLQPTQRNNMMLGAIQYVYFLEENRGKPGPIGTCRRVATQMVTQGQLHYQRSIEFLDWYERLDKTLTKAQEAN